MVMLKRVLESILGWVFDIENLHIYICKYTAIFLKYIMLIYFQILVDIFLYSYMKQTDMKAFRTFAIRKNLAFITENFINSKVKMCQYELNHISFQ